MPSTLQAVAWARPPLPFLAAIMRVVFGPVETDRLKRLLSWAFERILRHPDQYARLRAEIDAHDGGQAPDGGGDSTYLDAIVKETLRLCPAAPIVVRKLLSPMELGGYTIPTGTTVAPCVHLVHRRADIYPEPLRFRPERFLEKPAGTYTWFPFGGGVRRCLAASYAQLLMKQVISTVVSEVDLRAADPCSERAIKSAIAFVPHRHAMVVVTRRYWHDLHPQTRQRCLALP